MTLYPELFEDKTEKTKQAMFIKGFGSIYQKATGRTFLATKKHYIMVAKVLKNNSYDEAIEKSLILARHCKNCDVWFTKKDSWRAFSIETLISKWNSLLPLEEKSEEEIARNDLMRLIKEERNVPCRQ